MFCYLEEKIQGLNIGKRRLLIMGTIICALFLGYFASYYNSESIFKSFENIIFIGNMFFSFSLISFFSFRRKFSKRPYSKIHYFSQSFIILSLITIVLMDNNFIKFQEKEKIILIINIFIWYAVSLNISIIYSISKNNKMEYLVRNKTNPIVYLFFFIAFIYPFNQYIKFKLNYFIMHYSNSSYCIINNIN